MPGSVELTLEIAVRDSEGRVTLTEPRKTWRWTAGSLLPEAEIVSLTGSAFTALSPPSGARAVLIYPGAGVSLVLKGITGDSASITVAPTSAPIQIPLLLPLGASPVLGVLNSGNTITARVLWL